MAGSAILDPTVLLDSLIPVVDSLRTDLHPAFGVRAYRVFTILRTWSGRTIGEGVSSDVEVEIADPQPKVHTWNGLRYSLEPCGLNEAGQIKLTEWSLTYTEAEVIGTGLTKSQEWLIRVDEAHGQETQSRFFVHAKPPFIDRIDDIAWVCWLRSID